MNAYIRLGLITVILLVLICKGQATFPTKTLLEPSPENQPSVIRSLRDQSSHFDEDEKTAIGVEIKKYENNQNPLPNNFKEKFDSHFDFDFLTGKSCNASGPTIIFKSARYNFDRRKEIRQQLKNIDFASNYFFMSGQKSSDEKAPIQKKFNDAGSVL